MHQLAHTRIKLEISLFLQDCFRVKINNEEVFGEDVSVGAAKNRNLRSFAHTAPAEGSQGSYH